MSSKTLPFNLKRKKHDDTADALLLNLAKFSSYTKAANELKISISTLSRQILSIEDELNVQLFQRNNKNVSLTKCGNYMYRELLRIYFQYQVMTDNVRSIYQGYNGALSIGILDDITLNGKLQESFEKMKRKHPDIPLHWNEVPTGTDGWSYKRKI